MEDALKHFKKNDPILYKVALKVDLSTFRPPDDPLRQSFSEASHFIDLVESIVSQQLSGKAAETIFGRFKKLFPREQITPKKLLKIPDEKIRAAGISFSKIKYIKGIANEIVNNNLDLKSLEELTDEEVILELVKLKGIGKWTAEMFLMFTLGRPDVFSAGDLGLQNAIVKLYGLKSKPNNGKLLEISAKWSPHRTIASRILWKSLDLK